MKNNKFLDIQNIIVLCLFFCFVNVLFSLGDKMLKQYVDDSETELVVEKEVKDDIQQQKIQFKRTSGPSDDDICHDFEFINPLIEIKYTTYKQLVEPLTLGYPNFIFSPPDYLL